MISILQVGHSMCMPTAELSMCNQTDFGKRFKAQKQKYRLENSHQIQHGYWVRLPKIFLGVLTTFATQVLEHYFVKLWKLFTPALVLKDHISQTFLRYWLQLLTSKQQYFAKRLELINKGRCRKIWTPVSSMIWHIFQVALEELRLEMISWLTQ